MFYATDPDFFQDVDFPFETLEDLLFHLRDNDIVLKEPYDYLVIHDADRAIGRIYREGAYAPLKERKHS